MNREKIEAAARWLFEIDEEVARDRERFGTFDNMPPELQQWWRDRAERKISELQRLKARGLSP